MKKVILLIILILLVGCSKKDRVYLDDEFYGQSKFIKISEEKIEELKDIKSTYVLYTYNNFCTMPIPCEDIFEEFMKENNISFYSIPFSKFKNTYLHETIKFAPTIAIIKNGKILNYLDANSNKDYDYYQDVNKFTNWMTNQIYLEAQS